MNRLIISILLLSISGFTMASDPELEGSRWHLSRYLDESSAMSPVLTEVAVYLQFAEGRVSGSTGCNSYFGGYNIGPDSRLTLSERIGSTLKACAPPVTHQEQRYLALLPMVAAYRLESGSLALLDKEHDPILQYHAAKPAALENTRWQAAGINNDSGGVVSSATTHLSSALFANGRIGGNAGCNSFSAAYELGDGTIAIGPAMATRKYCATSEGIMEQEGQYLRALEQAHSCGLRPDGLELRDKNSLLQIHFIFADE